MPRHTPPKMRSSLAAHVLPVLVLGVTVALNACSSQAAGGEANHVVAKADHPYTQANVELNKNVPLPSYVTADQSDGYEYAIQHPEQLQYMPCYCGCGLTVGHKNNLECYIAGLDKAGAVVFDDHASFCSICIEITRDVKRLSAEGKSLSEIRAYVDQAHGEKGPGTETPLPPS